MAWRYDKAVPRRLSRRPPWRHDAPKHKKDLGSSCPPRPRPQSPGWRSTRPRPPSSIAEAPYRLIGDIARERAVATPTKTAFTCVMPNGMKGSLTFAEVDRLSDAFAAYLREDLALAAGDRVAMQIPNGLAYPVAAFGILKAGCILVNVNPLYTASEMAKLYADAEISALVIIDMFAGKLATALTLTKVPSYRADQRGRTVSGHSAHPDRARADPYSKGDSARWLRA